ncbi:MAG: hypothetical protein ABSG21_09880 [Spirochaetia bacterium]|jgi:hypothetical protein
MSDPDDEIDPDLEGEDPDDNFDDATPEELTEGEAEAPAAEQADTRAKWAQEQEAERQRLLNEYPSMRRPGE